MFTQDVFTTHDVFTKIHQSSATSPLNNHDHHNHQDNQKQDQDQDNHDQYNQDSHLGDLTSPPLQPLLSTTIIMTIILI